MVPLAPEPSGAFAFLLQAARHSALPLYGARF
jgi:hypothetical protein